MAKITYTHKRTRELTPKEFDACCDLTLKSGGFMQGMVECIYNKLPRRDCTTATGADLFQPHKSFVVLAQHRKKTVAWCLAVPITFDRYQPKLKWEFHFYVDKAWRRRGIARQLALRAKSKVRAQVYVFPHDTPSEGFFNRLQDEIRIKLY